MEKGGLDSAGREFKNAEEMWREQVGDDHSKKTEWYRQGVGYWEVSAFVNLLCFGFCFLVQSFRRAGCGHRENV